MEPNRSWRAHLVRGMLVVAGISFLLALTAPQAHAQLRFGPEVAVGSDSGFGMGVRGVFPLRVGGPLDGVIDALYSTPSGTDSWIQTNANVRLAVPLSPAFITTVGVGLNASFISFDDGSDPTTDTDTLFGMNVLGGVAYPREGVLGGRARPFAELRAVIGGAEEVVLTVGLTFGGP